MSVSSLCDIIAPKCIVHAGAVRPISEVCAFAGKTGVISRQIWPAATAFFARIMLFLKIMIHPALFFGNSVNSHQKIHDVHLKALEVAVLDAFLLEIVVNLFPYSHQINKIANFKITNL